jgi:hypothetical protein
MAIKTIILMATLLISAAVYATILTHVYSKDAIYADRFIADITEFY